MIWNSSMAPPSKRQRGAALESALRLRIAQLDAQGQSTNMIARTVGCSESAVKKWKMRARLGSLEVLPRSGRPPKWSQSFKRKILTRMQGKLHCQVRAMSRKTGVPRTTLRSWTKEFGLKPYHLRSRFMCTNASKKRRLQFAKDYRNFDTFLTNGVFADECHFQLHKRPNSRNDVVYATSPEGIPFVNKVQRDSAVRVWGAISKNGVLPLKFYSGNLTATRYTSEILHDVGQLCRSLFPSEAYIFVQDNAPCHRAKHTQRWMAQSDIDDFISAAEWPAYSPDLNPIEGVWSVLAERVHRRKPHNLTELKRYLKKEWSLFKIEELQKCCFSLKSRLKQVIERRGAQTDY